LTSEIKVLEEVMKPEDAPDVEILDEMVPLEDIWNSFT